MNINMPKDAGKIIQTLQQQGYEAYIVGGCVRDAVLNKEPEDWDITTSAKPDEVKRLFRRTIDTGIEHGTVTIMFGRTGYEVTTYRIDGKYEDHRRPNTVAFSTSLTEDLKRRDFTINAMAYNDVEGLIDEFGGLEDLEQGIIRCVGISQERFDEDALRILRAIRFGAQLNFDIEEETKKAIQEKAVFLKDISAERIRMELTKLFISPHPERVEMAYDLGITKIVLPEFDDMMHTFQSNPHHMDTVGAHAIRVLQNIEATPLLRWAALLHDVGKPIAKKVDENGIEHFYMHHEEGAKTAKLILRRLKFDNDTIDKLGRLVLWHDYGIGATDTVSKKTFRKALSKMGVDLFDDLIKLRRADVLSQSAYMQEEKLQGIDTLQRYYDEIMEEKDCLSVKDLDLNGKDLMEMGVPQGKEIGRILKELLDMVLENPEWNDKKMLKDKIIQLSTQSKAYLKSSK